MNLGTPWLLLLLPLVALAAWLCVRARRLQGEAASRLKGVAPADHSASLTRRDWLALLALACVALALARPRWNPRTDEVERRGRDLIIALDVSRSMLAADVFPSRLELARLAIHEAIPQLAGQRLALVTFAGSASVRVPLTLDHGFVRYMLDRADPADMDVGSTSLQAAIEKIDQTVLSDAVGGRRDLLVFTDGEDHLSDLDQTAERLARWDARVLIIGLGDPLQGARLPDARGNDQWLQHNGVEVISRLEERTLERLAEAGPQVTYYPVRTRPFDLVSLYRQWSADTHAAVVGGLRHVRYTEGYPYLLAFAVVLWLASASVRVPAKQSLILLVLLLPGCSPRIEEQGEHAFRARYKQGSELLQFAQQLAEADPLAERSLLVDSREQFLRAALLKPGDLETARQITAITRRLRELETVIEQQRADERKQREKLATLIQRLEQLAGRQEGLSQRSQRALRRRPIPTGEAANLPETEDSLPAAPLSRVAPPIAKEQRAVRQGTQDLLADVTAQRDTLREILTRAYGDVNNLPATEIDPIVELLAETVDAQGQALAKLVPGQVNLPRANTALHTAAGRMQQALDALRGLQPPQAEEEDEALASRKAADLDEGLEELDQPQDQTAPPVSPGDFQEALALQSLPIPDYTAEEILAEESANQQERTRRKAARAAARVEKNW
jgi:Ca-activated chloride channel homolog